LFERVSRFVVPFLLLLPLPAPAAAETDPFAALPRLERDALVRAVLERNPSLQAAHEAWRAASARPVQARALPDLTVSYGVAPLSIASSEAGFGQEVEVSQAFPFPGKRRARAAAAEAEAETAHEEYRAARVELAAAASLLFADYYLVDRAIEINAEHLLLVGDLQKVAAARYATGLVAQQEPLQAEVEAAELLHREVELRVERDVVAARINALLHRRMDDPLPPPPDRLPQLDDTGEAGTLKEATLAARPEVAARAAEIRVREAELELARLERKPDFGLMGSYNSMWTDTEHRFMVGVSVSLPVRRERLDAARAEAEARLAQERSELAGLEDEVRSEVRSAATRLAETHHLIEIYESRLLPASRDQIKAARAGYESGQAGFLSILEAERSLRRAELGYHETLAGLYRRRAELDRALGRLPAGLSDETLRVAPAAGQGGF
jgi:outer membrane protein TolC